MFVDYLGDNPRARLLDFLGDHPTSDYTITELSNKAHITRTTLYKAIEACLRVGMVVHTRDVGQSSFYKLNTDHHVVQSILAADMEQPEVEALVH